MIEPISPLARLLLAPPSALYGWGASVRNRLFEVGVFRSESLSVPVISVGNLTVGGTGKTPLVGAIAEILRQEMKVAILTRGYGGSRPGRTLILDASATGDRTGTVGRDGNTIAWVPAEADPAVAGDEPVLLARQLPSVSVVVGADRRATGRIAVEKMAAQVVLLDDGFQHRWIRRDLDIVVLDVVDPFGRYSLLPAGRLREPISAIRRAGAIVVTRSHPEDPLITLMGVVRRHNPEAPIFRGYIRPVCFVPLGGETTLDTVAFAGRIVAGFCGIGNPDAFRTDLRSLGAHVGAFETFRDHHRYRASDIDRLMRRAAECRAECLITTEKDAIRLTRLLLARGAETTSLPVFALKVRCEVEPKEAFFSLIERAAGGLGVSRKMESSATGLPVAAVGREQPR